MQRRVLLSLAVLLSIPAIAQAAITVTAGDHILAQSMAGQNIDILLSGAGGSDIYSGTSMKTTIASGGPVVTHVFGDTGGTISPASAYAASIWVGGSLGINLTPDGTTTSSTGQRTAGGFASPTFSNLTDNGIYATMTLSTIGVAPGVYAFSLSAHPLGATTMIFSIFDEDPESETFGELLGTAPVPGLVLANGTFTVTPEPGSIVLGLFAAAGLATVAIRRHRGRRAA